MKSTTIAQAAVVSAALLGVAPGCSSQPHSQDEIGVSLPRNERQQHWKDEARSALAEISNSKLSAKQTEEHEILHFEFQNKGQTFKVFPASLVIETSGSGETIGYAADTRLFNICKEKYAEQTAAVEERLRSFFATLPEKVASAPQETWSFSRGQIIERADAMIQFNSSALMRGTIDGIEVALSEVPQMRYRGNEVIIGPGTTYSTKLVDLDSGRELTIGQQSGSSSHEEQIAGMSYRIARQRIDDLHKK